MADTSMADMQASLAQANATIAALQQKAATTPAANAGPIAGGWVDSTLAAMVAASKDSDWAKSIQARRAAGDMKLSQAELIRVYKNKAGKQGKK